MSAIFIDGIVRALVDAGTVIGDPADDPMTRVPGGTIWHDLRRAFDLWRALRSTLCGEEMFRSPPALREAVQRAHDSIVTRIEPDWATLL